MKVFEIEGFCFPENFISGCRKVDSRHRVEDEICDGAGNRIYGAYTKHPEIVVFASLPDFPRAFGFDSPKERDAAYERVKKILEERK